MIGLKRCTVQVVAHRSDWVVAVDDPQWRNYLLFRDLLRADETLRARYAELKGALQEQFAQDRKGYTNAMNEFIRGILSGNRPTWGSRP